MRPAVQQCFAFAETIQKVGEHLFKNLKKKTRKKRKKKGFRPPKISLKAPLKAVGDAFGSARQAAEKATKEIGEKLEPVGDAVGKVAKPVGAVLSPVADAVDHVEHFLRTGDFGKQVEKLLAEQDEAKFELQEETYKLYDDAAVLVQVETRYHALAQIDKQMTGHGGRERGVVRGKLGQVEFDLYSNPGIDALEKVGLKPVAEGLRFVREIAFLMPNELMYKQVELAKVRKELRQNIARYEDATDEVRATRADIRKQIKKVRQQIREMEESFAAANIDISPTSVVEREVQDIESTASRTLAQALLEGGNPPAVVSQITGLSLEEVTALEAAA